MDLAIRFPTQGRIHLESRFLFSEPHHPNCRQFLERVFQVPEITQVTIRSQAGSQEIPRAELGFCPRTHSLKEVVDQVAPRCIEPGNGTHDDGHHGPMARTAANGSSASNGHAKRLRSSYAQVNGNGRPGTARHCNTSGVTFTSVTPVRDAKGEIRYFRYGTIVTHWEIKHELPGRLRLKNPVIHRKAELCQAIERELMGVLGIDYFKTNSAHEHGPGPVRPAGS